ncbi:sugar ABC transporter substrate-binding protein [Paenibacillus tarimensis]
MKRNKLIVLILSLVTTLALLVGCASNSGGSTGNGEKNTGGSEAKDGKIVIGAAMPVFDDKWLSYLYDAIKAYDEEHDDVEVIMVDAKNDVGKQLSQVETFVSQKVNAIMTVPVDTDSIDPILDTANAANIPVVVVNRNPSEQAMEKAYAYVGSESLEAGTMQMEKVAELLGGKGNIGIMNGTLGHESATKRTEGNKNVIAQHPEMKLVREQTADYQRATGLTLMENWIQSGDKLDAIVANNDEMAIGAIMALEAAGQLEGKVIAGIDGTMDALEYVRQGKLQVTVFQNANGQGKTGVETAVKAARGETLDDKYVWVPFELVTKDNVEEYVKKWQE